MIMRHTKKVQQLPEPENMPRVETGPVQFGNDWPGLFIRGDDCIALKCEIEKLLKSLDVLVLNVPLGADEANLRALTRLMELAKIIDKHVMVK